MIRIAVAVSLLVMAGGCRAQQVPAAAAPPVDLSELARQEAVIEAATQNFEKMVKEPFLVRKHMTVRGLTRAATRPRSNKPAPLSAAQYDPGASASAKLELVDGKVLYTASAAGHDPSAAVISDGLVRWRVAYEISAQLTPDGELTAFVFHHLGEARPEAE
jgi:hypothetical protein